MPAFLPLLLLVPGLAMARSAHSPAPPLRVGIVGLTHTHVHWILGRPDRGDVEIVGIAEPDRALAARYATQHGYTMDLVYDTLDELIEQARPEALVVFTSIRAHRAVVETAAQHGLHVMVEKPLAVSLDDARAMADVARAAGIHLLTNYETTWYASVHAAQAHAAAGDLGALRKIVVRDGHAGPAKLGVNPEFLDWLTDPVENGAGALMDFGCYGADLITWLLGGQRPLTVTAVTQQLQPEAYPQVDDEAIIVLTYPEAQGLIQASWNWPFSRKDLEIYGTTGYAYADDAATLRVRTAGTAETREALPPRPSPFDDPFAYFAAVVRGTHTPGADLSSLQINLVAMEILDAALRSARTGQTVGLRE